MIAVIVYKKFKVNKTVMIDTKVIFFFGNIFKLCLAYHADNTMLCTSAALKRILCAGRPL